MGLLFYRVAPPPPVISLVDGFEYADGWPGTLNTNPQFLTPSILDGFEYSDNWPETLNTNPQFLTPSVSDGFEAADGWSGTT